MSTATALPLPQPKTQHGTVTINSGETARAAQTLTYTPTANFNGSATINYTISDGELSASATVTVNVRPVNDAPTLSDGDITVAENAANGTVIATAEGEDVDDEDTLTYAITGGNDDGVFAIGSSSGELSVADSSKLNAETTPSYTLAITVTDSGELSRHSQRGGHRYRRRHQCLPRV